MQLPQEIRLLILIGTAFIIGIVVLLVHPQYRVEENLASNVDYYPESVSISPESTGTPALDVEGEESPEPVAIDETRTDMESSIEF